MGASCGSMGRTDVHARLTRQPEVQRLLRRPTRRWKNNIEMNLKYRVIHKSLRDFRTRLRNNQDRHGRREHIKGRESLQVFFVLGALAYLQVPPLGGSRDEKWRSQ